MLNDIKELREANVVLSLKNGKVKVIKNRNGETGEVSIADAIKIITDSVLDLKNEKG